MENNQKISLSGIGNHFYEYRSKLDITHNGPAYPKINKDFRIGRAVLRYNNLIQGKLLHKPIPQTAFRKKTNFGTPITDGSTNTATSISTVLSPTILDPDTFNFYTWCPSDIPNRETKLVR